jgi:imidazolonepropionase-like amidohydrolase
LLGAPAMILSRCLSVALAVTASLLSACSTDSVPPSNDGRGDPEPTTGVGCDGCIVLVGGKVFDGTRAIEQATVVIKDGKIESVTPGEARVARGEVIDVRGKTILPGLIDMHAHVNSTWMPSGAAPIPMLWEKAFKALLRAGVTTAVDLQTPRVIAAELRDRTNEGMLLGPHFFFAGPKLSSTGEGTCPPGLPPLDYCVRVDTVDQARAAVQALLPFKPTFVKLALDPNGRMARDAMSAVSADAEAAGIHAIAHIADTKDAEAALDAGVRFFAHVPLFDEVSPALARRMADLGVVAVPTAAVQDALYRQSVGPLEELADRDIALDVPAELVSALRAQKPLPAATQEKRKSVRKNALTNLARLHEAGVRIAAGTDSGVYGAFFGLAMRRELALYVEAGLTPEAALAAATRVPADALGRSDLGRIEPGAMADVLVVDGDPLTDIQALRNVSRVYLAGVLVDRDALELPRKTSLTRVQPTPGKDGDACVSSDDCGALTCSSRSACRKSCTSPAGCAAGSSCLPETPTSGVCTPSEGCDLFAQDCANSAACIFHGNGTTFCWFAGVAGEGEPCTNGLCMRGLQCDPAKGLCRKICKPGAATGCAAGRACEDFAALAGLSVGLCER